MLTHLEALPPTKYFHFTDAGCHVPKCGHWTRAATIQSPFGNSSDHPAPTKK